MSTLRLGFDPPSAFLELNSLSLRPLPGSLFNNSLFAQQLDSRYGLPKQLRDVLPVSYTHLTLPTKRIV